MGALVENGIGDGVGGPGQEGELAGQFLLDDSTIGDVEDGGQQRDHARVAIAGWR